MHKMKKGMELGKIKTSMLIRSQSIFRQTVFVAVAGCFFCGHNFSVPFQEVLPQLISPPLVSPSSLPWPCPLSQGLSPRIAAPLEPVGR